MKDFDLCYFIWKLLYKNNIILYFNNDKNTYISIQMNDNKLNIDEKILIKILSQLVIQDFNKEKKFYIIDKTDYKEYLDFLRESEIIYRKNPLIDENNLQEKFSNENIINYILNYIVSMACNYFFCDNDDNKLIKISINSLLSDEIEIYNYSTLPLSYIINMFYKQLIDQYKENERLSYMYNNLDKVNREFVKTVSQAYKDGKSEDEIDEEIEKVKQNYNDRLEKESHEFNKYYEDLDFFGKSFH